MKNFKAELFLYFILAIISGLLLTLMIYSNARFAFYTDSIYASWFAHGTGFIFALILVLLLKFSNRNKKLSNEKRKIPFYLFLGGIPGSLTVVISSFSVSNNLSLASAISLMLVGQVTFSLICDYFGLFSLKKRKISKNDVLSILFILIGSAMILYGGKQI